MTPITILRKIHRRGYHLAVLAIITVFLVLGYHHAPPEYKGLDFNLAYAKSQKTLTDNAFFQNLQDSFYLKVVSRIQQVYLNDNTKGGLGRRFRIEKYLDTDEKPHLIRIPDHDGLPSIQPYDPRFTFGLLALYLSQSLDEITNNSFSIPYFHWADYVSLPDIFTDVVQKSTCEEKFPVPPSRDLETLKKLKLPQSEKDKVMKMAKKENRHTDSKHNCFNDDDIDSLIEEKSKSSDPSDIDFVSHLRELKQNSKHSMGWHVYQRTDFKMEVDHRANMSEGYLYEFMSPPHLMVLLLPSVDSKSPAKIPLKINIERGEGFSKTQLKDTPMFLSIRQRNKDEEDLVLLDLAKEIRKLAGLVLSKTSVSSFNLNALVHLSHEDFIDESSKYFEELSKMEKNSMDSHTRQYFDALDFSLKQRHPPKYLYEALLVENARIGGHYDWRFFLGAIIIPAVGNKSPIPVVIKDRDVLNNSYTYATMQMYSLIRAWLSFTQVYGFKTWLAHGTLLGWFSTGLPFPWDNDYDVQMPIRELHRLAKEFNQSMIVDFAGEDGSEIKYGRYFIDITSSLSQRTHDGKNNIDGRFIDVDTGYYIDITGMAVSETKVSDKSLYQRLPDAVGQRKYDKNNYLKLYNCRNQHFANLSQLTPLKLTTFQGYPAYVPNMYESLVRTEYPDYLKPFSSLHAYIPAGRTWIPASFLLDTQGPVKNFVNVNDEEVIKALLDNEDKLIEYVINAPQTLEHEKEIAALKEDIDYAYRYLNSGGGEYKGPFRSLLRSLFNYEVDIAMKPFDKAMKAQKEALGE